jgi:hypothetical protein
VEIEGVYLLLRQGVEFTSAAGEMFNRYGVITRQKHGFSIFCSDAAVREI